MSPPCKCEVDSSVFLGIDARQWRGGERSAEWDSVGCVSMWWCMYIEGYIFVFWYTEEIGLLYMFPLIPSYPSISLFSKNRSDAAGGCPQTFCFFFAIPFFFAPKKKVLVYVLLILILFVHFSKSMYKQFAQNDTSFAHISKFSESSLPSPFKPFLKIPSTLKVIID